ncbi:MULTISPECIES: hypothetical protein [unclassified Duganella]|uniref:hypothetical protein n=1 Tax=unclassified Duganella TaxID=2636909 RepID=UPI000E348D13|nr:MULTISPECIES: hypothetical protein [unclassified Duganella]RFP08133.1 hypothetical protein D0T23_30345 [Duganella sp. BJB475]RFP36186.1 hypothetical protein D0T21_07065 [Duganella sp. BJB476]
MRPFIRFLLWILIAALPLQGTAVVLIPCATLTLPVQSVSQPTEHCAPAKSDQQTSGAHGKCSHCASCVGASAPPAVPSLVLPASFSGAGFIAAEPSMTAYIPATLERPPRLS